MNEQVEAARKLLARCMQLRNDGRAEAVLRAELASHLRVVFSAPEDASWVDHYTEGSEAGTKIGQATGPLRHRFIDNLVRSTVIEYEPDLRIEARWKQGYSQVQEYAAGTITSGTPPSQVRGILSDTVDWHVFDIAVVNTSRLSPCSPDNVQLIELDAFIPEQADEATATRFTHFLRKHLAREQSRPVTSAFIATDLGLDSAYYLRHSPALIALIQKGRSEDSSVVFATDLWSHFVDYLEGERGTFRAEAYVDETYVGVLARLLCANILNRRALLSDDERLSGILTGDYFEQTFHLHNIVEQDYFGWLLRSEYLGEVLPVAREMQRDLYAYDFAHIAEEDLFGRLMTQLSRRSDRKLLGQEWTPQWIAVQLADKCLSLIPPGESPRIIDMCCGSGSMIAEVLKATRRKFPSLAFAELHQAVTGFDIDPLAVLLSKTTWVVTLAAELRLATGPVTIPIYHADSLFAVTPISRSLPLPGTSTEVALDLDGKHVSLPSEMITPVMRQFFDDVIDWCYDEARDAQRSEGDIQVNKERVTTLVDALSAKHRVSITPEVRLRVIAGVLSLSYRMAELAVANRNGIWAFILRNAYRPGLLAGQFNGLVSNPPWLAMSQLADNPYKGQLSVRAITYDIKPSGASHLHLELATTHLLHAIGRYLQDNAAVACLVPGTILNGQHHAKFRAAAYLKADRPIPFELSEVWEVEPGTFKVRCAAVIGKKRPSVEHVKGKVPTGAIAAASGLRVVPWSIQKLGSRTAWVLGEASKETTRGADEVPPQGADLMPRTAVCVEILDRSGLEWQVRTPRRGDPTYYAVKDAKKLATSTFDGHVAPAFLHRMVQSLNLLPFTLDGNFASIAIPARKDSNGEWEILEASAIRTEGMSQTARRFQGIDKAMEKAGLVDRLHEKINERNKLELQVFPRNGFFVFNGAGGGIACAACLPVQGYGDLVVDQTLYWRIVQLEQEAWYRVGLMNSDTLSEAVNEFVPSGEFGKRHLHTLPNRVMPTFDATSDDHVAVATLARELAGLARPLIVSDPRIADPAKPIASRRKCHRKLLKELTQFAELEEACATVLLK